MNNSEVICGSEDLKQWDGTAPVPVGIALTDMEFVCVPQSHTMGLRIQGELLIVSLRLKTLLSKLVAEVQFSVLQCLELEPNKCLCVRLILRVKNDATSSLMNALKLFRLVNSDIAMPDRSSVLAYLPDVTHVHRPRSLVSEAISSSIPAIWRLGGPGTSFFFFFFFFFKQTCITLHFLGLNVR